MARAIANESNSRIVSVMSSSLKLAREVACEVSADTACASIEDIVGHSGVDAVYISNTNERHASSAISAARGGKHILCEKPLAMSMQDAHAIVEACAEANVTLGVNHHLRAAGAHRAIRDLVKSGVVGAVTSLRTQHVCYASPEARDGWRMKDPSRGAGVTFDLTVHTADLVRFLLGDEIVAASACTGKGCIARSGIEDTVTGAMRLASGAATSFFEAFSPVMGRSSLELYGTEGALIAHNTMSTGTTGTVSLAREHAWECVDVRERPDPYDESVAQFAQAVRGSGAPLASGRDGLRSLAVVLAVREAFRTGRSVPVDSDPAHSAPGYQDA
jgi:1,5-anhydro-D-fructose reductase (1,5-anhydro-D-mannitol-forming)